MLIGLQFCYSLSTASFSVNDGPICGLDIPNKLSLHEDCLIISYFWQGAINSRVIGLGTWCSISNIQQKGGKWMAPS